MMDLILNISTPLSTMLLHAISQAFYRTAVRPRIPAAPTIPMTKPLVAAGAPPVEVEVSGVVDLVAVDPDAVVLIVDDDDDDDVMDELAV
jgi:hypothetical protein